LTGGSAITGCCVEGGVCVEALRGAGEKENDCEEEKAVDAEAGALGEPRLVRVGRVEDEEAGGVGGRASARLVVRAAEVVRERRVGELSGDARVVEREAVRGGDVLDEAVHAERAVHERGEAGERAQDEAEAAHLVVGDRVHGMRGRGVYTRGGFCGFFRDGKFGIGYKRARSWR
jgi:hypothetical protein